MSLRHLAFSVQYPPLHHTSNCFHWPFCRIIIGFSNCQRLAVHSNHHGSLMKNIPLSFTVSWSRPHLLRTFPASVEAIVLSDMRTYSDSSSSANLRYEAAENEERCLSCQFDSAVAYPTKEMIETERRRKIGLANKGRVPWNKGRKHTAETRAKIKQRTIEAMREPKVRRKMSEARRVRSEQVKAKISSSLRQLWGERLKRKRSMEKFYLSWVGSIAEAARKGGINEEELDWRSYEKIKNEIAIQQLQWAVEKNKQKEMKRIKNAREEKMPRVTERKRRVEARAKTKGKLNQKRKPEKEVVTKELDLKTRLTKIHLKKSLTGQLFSQGEVVVSRCPALERLDLKLMEKGKTQKEISFADQIRAAKSRRAESADIEAFSLTL